MMKDTEEWRIGDIAQRRWCAHLADRGALVLPTHELEDNAPGTKAPMLLAGESLMVAPDALVFYPGGAMWYEIKAKSRPDKYRIKNRWEHGIDYANAMEYRAVQDRSGLPVVIVLYEERPEQIWLRISLNEALSIGDHRPDWPGGKAKPWDRGRDGQGGLLWDRAAMHIYRNGP